MRPFDALLLALARAPIGTQILSLGKKRLVQDDNSYLYSWSSGP